MADAELASRFSPDKALEPDVEAELRSMMRLYDLSAEDLFFKWESHCIRMERDVAAMSLAEVRALKRGIQDELEERRRREAAHAHAATGRRRVGVPTPGKAAADVFGMLDGLVPGTPASGRKLAPRAPGSGGAARRAGAASSPLAGGTMADQLQAVNGLPEG
ncbi:hypothetical protein CDD83_10839 [Cordyceps sp. RAO-2017]|nr:hypothetical protein CDD83_10839 [Cordyceps sp. RAO-2017]